MSVTIPGIAIRRVPSLVRWLRVHRINDTIHIQWRLPWDEPADPFRVPHSHEGEGE